MARAVKYLEKRNVFFTVVINMLDELVPHEHYVSAAGQGIAALHL